MTGRQINFPIQSVRSVLFFLGLLVLALVCSQYSFHFIYGIELTFSSIFLLIAVRLYGWLPGLIGALALRAISVYVFHDPLLDVTGLLEIAFIGSVARFRQLHFLLWELIYWIAVAAPVTFLLNTYVYQAETVDLVMLMTVMAANGMCNALIADILLTYLPLGKKSGFPPLPKQAFSISQVLIHLSVASVTLPFFIYLVVNSWHAQDTVTYDSYQLALNTEKSIEQELARWSPEDIRGIKLMGAIQLGYLQEIVDKNTSESLFHIIITDERSRVLAGSDTRLKFQQMYDWHDGRQVIERGRGFYQSLPLENQLRLPIQSWREGSYIYESSIKRAPIRVYISIPIEMYQSRVFQQYIVQFQYLFVFAMFAVVLAMFINRFMVRGLSQLAGATTGLPDKLRDAREIFWPNSRFDEIRSLVYNFRDTSENLVEMFRELETMNEELQQQTSKLRQSEDKLHHLAYYDALTGLPNRLHFSTYLSNVLEQADRTGSKIAVMFADLNRFKQINDTLGHAMGDLLLREVARKYALLQSGLCRVFRIGGDEFVLVAEYHDDCEVLERADMIVNLFAEPIALNDTTLYVTTSVGVSVYPDDGLDMETIIKNADLAMYHAKEQGDNIIHFFQAALDEQITEKMRLDIGLREAIQSDQLRLYYQPKINGVTGKLSGIEALIRWFHPEMGLVTPDRFIPLAEESGLIIDIDEWVLREACRQNKAWQDAGLPAVPVSVNISGKHFNQGDLLPTIERILSETGLSASYLCLEITEGIFIRNVDRVIAIIAELRARGIHIDIDDFGTGYSSLSQLQRLPVYKVKLDRSFIAGVTMDVKKAAVIKAVIELAHSMGLQVVVEGIETPEEMCYFVELGCDELQGFYFSRPLPQHELGALLAQADRNYLSGADVRVPPLP